MSKIKKTVGIAAGVSALAGSGMNAIGLYSIVNATTGATMLGSTAAGVSAAGTTGIIAGTSGVVGTVGAFLMAPPAIGVFGVVALAVGGHTIYKKFKSK